MIGKGNFLATHKPNPGPSFENSRIKAIILYRDVDEIYESSIRKRVKHRSLLFDFCYTKLSHSGCKERTLVKDIVTVNSILIALIRLLDACIAGFHRGLEVLSVKKLAFTLDLIQACKIQGDVII
jgi:hypothetical protein